MVADRGEAVARRGPVNEGTEQEKYGDRWPGDQTKTGFPGGRFPRERFPGERFPRERFPGERFPRGTFRFSEGKPSGGRLPDGGGVEDACPSDIASFSSGSCGNFGSGSLESEQHTGDHPGGRNLVGDHSGRWELIGGCLKGECFGGDDFISSSGKGDDLRGDGGRLGEDSGRPESGE